MHVEIFENAKDANPSTYLKGCSLQTSSMRLAQVVLQSKAAATGVPGTEHICLRQTQRVMLSSLYEQVIHEALN